MTWSRIVFYIVFFSEKECVKPQPIRLGGV